ncbi:hypothetical protein GCM10023198_57510 [Promicromonospora umidemergens]|uniref:Uncharacterized protein n=1 Tax=Promicromonospora umidemergens TaxID=629679 RepID=A0ABP8YDU5_9MICO
MSTADQLDALTCAPPPILECPREDRTRRPSDAAEPTGVEPDLVRDFAEHLGAEVGWGARRRGDPRRLAAEELDLVIGGLTSISPWATAPP